MKLGPVDFKQPSIWRGIAWFAALFGISASPDLTNVIRLALGAVLSAIEIGRNEFASKDPLSPLELHLQMHGDSCVAATDTKSRFAGGRFQ